jgi:hypothetical protein
MRTLDGPTSPITIQVRVYVARTPEVVFDYFADLRNEPQYNGQVRDIVKTSPDPIAKDTTFEGWHRGIGRVTGACRSTSDRVTWSSKVMRARAPTVG